MGLGNGGSLKFPDKKLDLLTDIYTGVLSFSLDPSVVVRKLQFTILTRSSCEISKTVRIDCHFFLSLICISVRLSKFLLAKNIQKLTRKPSIDNYGECLCFRAYHREQSSGAVRTAPRRQSYHRRQRNQHHEHSPRRHRQLDQRLRLLHHALSAATAW